MENRKSCLVIGAGIAGLLAARTLQEQGVQVTVLDKGRGVGGRMATRRIGSAVFDHGAQFFTARDPRFRALADALMMAGAAEEWCRGFAGPAGSTEGDGHPRYCGTAGMTAVAKELAQGVDVQLSQRVMSAEIEDSYWKVQTELGGEHIAGSLLLTAPVPQSLAILDAGGVVLPTEIRAKLETVSYDPCIALMVQPMESRIPFPGGLQLAGEPIAWIGDNRQKGISPTASVTIHAGVEFSRAHWNSEDSEVASRLLSAAGAWISSPGLAFQVHRWRYAKPSALYPAACLTLNEPLPLAFAGDAFGTPRVEGAALSGLAAAQAILDARRKSI